MNSIIEELYYGNLEPWFNRIKEGSDAEREMGVLSDAEEVLMSVLTDEERKIFCRYVGAWATINDSSNLDAFTSGFRLGARLTLDTFGTEDGMPTELTEE